MRKHLSSLALIPSLVGYLLTATAVLVIPAMALAAEDRSPYFWYKVLWAEYLALVVWAYVGGFLWYALPHRHSSARGGILPITGILVITYAIASLKVLWVFDWPSGLHWAIQTGLFTVLILLFVFLEFARIGASAGADPIPDELTSPQALAALLRAEENRLWTPAEDSPRRRISDAVKNLRETVQYSIPHAGVIGQKEDYKQLSISVEEYCVEVQSFPSNSDDEAAANRLRDRGNLLENQIRRLSAQLTVAPR